MPLLASVHLGENAPCCINQSVASLPPGRRLVFPNLAKNVSPAQDIA